MKILISAIGNTDPISHLAIPTGKVDPMTHEAIKKSVVKDAAMLHLARIERPDKIVLLYSQRMYSRHDDIIKAIGSIKDYNPEIVVEKPLISDNEIAIFDKMYAYVSRVVAKYKKNEDDEIILNLTSATPQIIGAFFAVNRLEGHNVTAFQVLTPAKSSNVRGERLSIDELIERNQDGQESFENRTVQDRSEKFLQSITLGNLRTLINEYDYQGVYTIIKKNPELLPKDKFREISDLLEKIVVSLRTQSLLPIVEELSVDETQKRALNAFLLLDLSRKRHLVADVLIKAKSLTELVLQAYFNKIYLYLIQERNGRAKISENHDKAAAFHEYLEKKYNEFHGKNGQSYRRNRTLNLHSYYAMLDLVDPIPKDLKRAVEEIMKTNNDRNKVAHGFKEITALDDVAVKTLVANLKQLLTTVYEIDDSIFNYFEKQNERLIKLLHP